MRTRFRAGSTSFALLVAVAAFAGCFGSDDAEAPMATAPEAPEDPAFAGVGGNATGGLGLAETNKTTGNAHIHDYWGEKREIVLVDQVLSNHLSPFPSGSPNVNDGVFFSTYEFPYGTIVYEGTGRLAFTVSELDPTLTGLKIRYLTPEATDFSEFVSLSPDVPLELAVTPRMTDMPHSTASGWAFEFYADGASSIDWGDFRFKVVAYKANNVEKWPAHPDFYRDLTHRVVLDTEARTTVRGVSDSIVFDEDIEWVRPEKLVSMGTQRVVVFLNVTGVQTPPGFDPAGYILEYKNATGHRVGAGERVSPSENSTSLNEMAFDIWVDVGGHDAPYAEQSRWGFRPRAIFTDTAGFGLCPGCFEYTVDYHITVIAYPYPTSSTVADTPESS